MCAMRFSERPCGMRCCVQRLCAYTFDSNLQGLVVTQYYYTYIIVKYVLRISWVIRGTSGDGRVVPGHAHVSGAPGCAGVARWALDEVVSTPRMWVGIQSGEPAYPSND